jgi:hypothetical protein
MHVDNLIKKIGLSDKSNKQLLANRPQENSHLYYILGDIYIFVYSFIMMIINFHTNISNLLIYYQ